MLSLSFLGESLDSVSARIKETLEIKVANMINKILEHLLFEHNCITFGWARDIQ